MRLRVDIALFWAYKNGLKTRFTTRFHSFTDRNIPSVYDYQFIGDLFTDVFTDGLRPLAFLLSVILHSVAISVGNTKKSFADGFTDGIFAQKKSFPLEIYRRIFIPSVISWFTDGYVPSVYLSVSVWNTDRIYPSVNSSVIVAATVKCWWIHFVGKAVCECMKYRPNISVCKCVGEYGQMPTDSFRR